MVVVVITIVVLVFIYYRLVKTGSWKKGKPLSNDYINRPTAATNHLEMAKEGRDQFDMNSNVSMKTRMSIQSRKEKGSSVVGSELPFELPAELDSVPHNF